MYLKGIIFSEDYFSSLQSNGAPRAEDIIVYDSMKLLFSFKSLSLSYPCWNAEGCNIDMSASQGQMQVTGTLKHFLNISERICNTPTYFFLLFEVYVPYLALR